MAQLACQSSLASRWCQYPPYVPPSVFDDSGENCPPHCCIPFSTQLFNLWS